MEEQDIQNNLQQIPVSEKQEKTKKKKGKKKKTYKEAELVEMDLTEDIDWVHGWY